MTRRRRAWEIATLVSAGAGLLAGLMLLGTRPLAGVLTILGSMGLVLSAAAGWCGTGIGL